MKKLFLFIATIGLALAINSCSSDGSDSNSYGEASGSITAKFDGEIRTFTNIIVLEEGNGSYRLSASMGTILTEKFITMSFNQGTVGANIIHGFNYSEGNNNFATTFTSLTTINNSNHLKGTFSGDYFGYDDSGEQFTVTVTEGSYDISY